MNLIVSILICVGYAVDYTVDVILTTLLINSKIDAKQEAYFLTLNKIFLTLCIFAAYVILMKVFMTYAR